MSPRWQRRNLFRLAALVPLLAITPLALSPTEGVRENRACADDTCIELTSDFCYVNGSIIWDHAPYTDVW